MTDHDHISDLRWDRWLAGDLPDAERVAVDAHAAGCAACSTRHRELVAEQDAFVQRPVGVQFSPPAARRRWRLGAPLAALAAAAVAVLVLARRPDGGDSGERTKGRDVHLLLSAGNPDRLVALAIGDAIHPGDYLQAGYTASRAGFGCVLSLDGAGSAIAYVPSRGDAMLGLPAGVELSYPESTVLDAVVGTEVIIVLWCETAHPLNPLLDELRRTRRITTPAGCVDRSLALDKRVEPR